MYAIQGISGIILLIIGMKVLTKDVSLIFQVHNFTTYEMHYVINVYATSVIMLSC